ncbi:MAG: hypothetical protein WC568_00980 [Candidatus Methanoperedens sp.]
MDYSPEPGEATLQYFKRTRQFCCVILVAWNETEYHIGQSYAKAHGLFHEDEEAQILLEKNSFKKQIDFLKKKSVITEDEYDTFDKFRKYRNKLYHGEEWAFFILNKIEMDKIMDESVEAAQLAQDIGLRVPMAKRI